MNDLVALAAERKWLALGAVLVGLAVRLSKDDNRFPLNVPARWRAWFSVGLGILAGALDLVVGGASWQDAAVAALVMGLSPILGNELFVEPVKAKDGGK
jgi:drug/metabolite transporter (DMT)-like permease